MMLLHISSILYFIVISTCSLENPTDTLPNSIITSSATNESTNNTFFSELSCIDTALKADEYEWNSDGSVYIKRFNISIKEAFYGLQNNTLVICKQETKLGGDADFAFQNMTNRKHFICNNITLALHKVYLFSKHNMLFKTLNVAPNKPPFILKNNFLDSCKSVEEIKSDLTKYREIFPIPDMEITLALFLILFMLHLWTFWTTRDLKELRRYTISVIGITFFLFFIPYMYIWPLYTNEDINYAFHNMSSRAFLNCTNMTLGPAEYELKADGTLFTKMDNFTLSETYYRLGNSTVTICRKDNKYNDSCPYIVENISCLEGLGAIVFCIAFFIQSCVLMTTQNVNKIPRAAVVVAGASLTALDFVCIILHLYYLPGYQDMYYTVPSLSHFFLISVFFWLSLLSFFKLFDYPPSKNFSLKLNRIIRKLCSLLINWISFMGALYSLYNNCENNFSFCWLNIKGPSLTAYAPAILWMYLFNTPVHLITKVPLKWSEGFVEDKDIHRMRQRVSLMDNHVLFFCIFLSLIVAWFIGVLGRQMSFSWMYHVFVVLHLFQSGVLIYKAKAMYKKSDFVDLYMAIDPSLTPRADHKYTSSPGPKYKNVQAQKLIK